MKTLEELRHSIDVLDQELLKLIAERLELVKEVGQYKKEHQLTPPSTGTLAGCAG